MAGMLNFSISPKSLNPLRMPIIGKIKGILLRMFYADHAPPHFHATNNEDEGLFKIDDLEMIIR